MSVAHDNMRSGSAICPRRMGVSRQCSSIDGRRHMRQAADGEAGDEYRSWVVASPYLATAERGLPGSFVNAELVGEALAPFRSCVSYDSRKSSRPVAYG